MNGITIKVKDGVVDITTSFDKRALDLNNEEREVATTIISTLVESGIDAAKLEVVRKSDDYATIMHRGSEWNADIARFKFTPRAKWVSIEVPESRRSELSSNAMFDAQKNKKQAMWKSKISSIDDVKPLAILAYEGLREMQLKFPEYR